jgi:ferritin-like metal-binding protein YciE
MSAPNNLEDIFADELKDLWSANEQMSAVVKVMAEKAHDANLKQALQKSMTDIKKHADTIKTLLADSDESVEKEHCKGMEGLVKEAIKHISKQAPKSGELLDIEILAQYQRMSHYGLAGFGTAAAYAKALGKKDGAAKLTSIVSDIHRGDDFASKLAEKTESVAKAA